MKHEELSEQCVHEIEVSCRYAYPQECCGIVDLQGRWHECTNMADEPEVSFKIDGFEMGELARTVGIRCIVHSHTKSKLGLHICTPSLSDVEGQKKSGVPWIIFGCTSAGVSKGMALPPVHNPEYLGRPYVYGLQDCGTLLWDFYFYEFGLTLCVPVELSLVKRKEWGGSVSQVIQLNGFTELPLSTSELHKGDVLLVSSYGERRAHGVLYIGDGLVINQGDVSSISPFSSYVNHVEAIYRKDGVGGRRL